MQVYENVIIFASSSTCIGNVYRMYCRAFLENVLHGTLMELSGTGDFQSLIDAVTVQKERKAGLQETILRHVARL